MCVLGRSGARWCAPEQIQVNQVNEFSPMSDCTLLLLLLHNHKNSLNGHEYPMLPGRSQRRVVIGGRSTSRSRTEKKAYGPPSLVSIKPCPSITSKGRSPENEIWNLDLKVVLVSNRGKEIIGTSSWSVTCGVKSGGGVDVAAYME